MQRHLGLSIVLIFAAFSMLVSAANPVPRVFAQGDPPSLSLSPDHGQIGNTVIANGSGFCTGTNLVEIDFDGNFVETITTNGNFPNLLFTIPNTTPGSHTVKATDQCFLTATATLTVDPPSISLSPDHGQIGSNAMASGSGFAGGITTIISLSFDGTFIHTGVSGRNTFTNFPFTVPNAAPGSHTVLVEDDSGFGLHASAIFTVDPPSLLLSSSSGLVGDSIIATASGFATGSTIASLSFDGTFLTSTTGVTGAFQLHFTVPSTTPGSHTVFVEDNSGLRLNASATFTVITAQSGLQLVKTQINSFQSSGVLTSGEATSLLTKATEATIFLNSGMPKTACNQLAAFVNQVNSFVSDGTFTQSEANLVLGGSSGITAIIASISC